MKSTASLPHSTGARARPPTYNTDDHIRRALGPWPRNGPLGLSTGERTPWHCRHPPSSSPSPSLDAEDTARVFDCTVHLRGPTPGLPGRRRPCGLRRRVTFLAPPSSTFRARFRTTTPRIASPAWKTRRSGPPSGRRGGGDGAEIVLYSGHPMWATRVWWMLRALGVFSKVSTGAWLLKRGCAPGYGAKERLRAGRADHLTKACALGRSKRRCSVPLTPPASAPSTRWRLVLPRDGGANYGRRGHITGSVNVPFAALFQGSALNLQILRTLKGA